MVGNLAPTHLSALAAQDADVRWLADLGQDEDRLSGRLIAERIDRHHTH